MLFGDSRLCGALSRLGRGKVENSEDWEFSEGRDGGAVDAMSNGDVELNSLSNGRKFSDGDGGEYVTVFENDDDDGYILEDQEEDLGLLDWDQYARIRRRQCCGVNCPDFGSLAPLWWYKLPKNRRRQLAAVLPALAFFVLLAVIVGFVFNSNQASGSSDSNKGGGSGGYCSSSDSYVLPRDFVPIHYDVELDVNWNARSPELMAVAGTVSAYFGGNATSGGDAGDSIVHRDAGLTSCLALHAGANVKVTRAAVVTVDGETISPSSRYVSEQEQLKLLFDEPLDPRRVHHVTLDFSYPLAESMRGFYRSSYRNSQNETHVLASTQFESTDARRAFPCFDEPNMKSTFDFKFNVRRLRSEVERAARNKDDFQVLFNTPLRQGGYRRNYDGDDAVDTYAFETTPRMSTYLVAFVIGDLVKQTKLIDGGRVTVSVWGTPEKGGDLSDALDSCVKILPAYEKLFGIPFPLKKLDLVAIPSFEAGAMENWGLITYRESSLLVNKDEASDFDVFWATVTVAHELAHMWFGNLVTMDWWNDLFLNEGFAEYVQYIGVTVAKPEYAADTLFPVITLQGAFYADSFPSSHPLHVPYEETLSTIEIDGLFDGITYDKGASVIRMLRAHMSEGESIFSDGLLSADPFIQGVRSYLKEYRYENAKSAQFWKAMAESTQSSKFSTIAEDMQSWIAMPNYPVLQAEWKTPPSQGQDGVLRLSQQPFLETGLGTCEDGPISESKWWLPYSYVTSGTPGSVERGILETCKSGALQEIALGSQDEYVLFNPDQQGFYRVNYPDEMWVRLTKGIESGDLSSVDASLLLDDAYTLVDAKDLGVSTLLDLSFAASRRNPRQGVQSDYQAWRGVSQTFNGVEGKLEESACHSDFKALVSKAVSAAISAYGIVPSLTQSNAMEISGSFQHRLLVGLLFSLGVEFGDSQVEQLALQGFNGENKVHPNLRYPVYKATARSGLAGYNEVLSRYRVALDADEKEKLMWALGAVTDKDLIQKSLGLILSDDIESMDVRSFVARIAGSSLLGRQLAWKYLQDNFEAVYEKVNGSLDVTSSRLAKLVSAVCSAFSSDERLKELEVFYSKYSKWIPSKVFQKTEESIRTNKAWMERNEQDVCEWERKNRLN